MKKAIVAGIVVVVVFAIGYSMKHYLTGTPGQAPEVSPELNAPQPLKPEAAPMPTIPELIRLLPDQTDIVLKLGSIETLFEHFSVTENSIFGQPVDWVPEVEASLGFNPLSINDLRNNSVDTNAECGLIIANFSIDPNIKDMFTGDVFACIPVTDPQYVEQTVITMFTKDDPNVSASRQQGYTVLSKAGQPEKLYIVPKENYLFFGMNPKADAIGFVQKLMENQHRLSDTAGFEQIVRGVDPNKNVFAYLNVPHFITNLEQSLQNVSDPSHPELKNIVKALQYMKHLEAMGAEAEISTPDLHAKGLAIISPNSPTANLLSQRNVNKQILLGIGDNPLLLACAAVHMPTYNQMIRETMSQEELAAYHQQLAMIQSNYGIDLEKDVIDNLDGSFNLGIYDGISINMMNYNLLVSFGVKDQTQFQQTLDKLATNPQMQSMMSKTTIGNKDAWMISLMGMTQLFVTTRDNQVIVSMGKTMAEKALNGDPSKGFLSTMAFKTLGDRIRGNSGLFYLNFAEVAKAVRNFSGLTAQMNRGQPMDQTIEQVLSQFDYILSTDNYDDNRLQADFRVQTHFQEPFLQGIKHLVDTLKINSAQAGG